MILRDTWIEHQLAADNTTAQATKTADPDKIHYIVAVYGSYIGTLPAAGLTNLALNFASTTKSRRSINGTGQASLEFSNPVAAAQGEAISGLLSAGGAGSIASVTIVGFSVDATP